MANDLSTLAPTLYSAALVVSNEPVGFIDAINMTFDDKGVAKGDYVDVPVAPTRSASDFTPSNTSSTGSDATADDVRVQITHSRKVSWHLTGEQRRSLENGGTDQEWIRQLFIQGMRTLRNEAEVVCADYAYQGACRAIGTAGTTPFATSVDILADARKELRDNGAPWADMNGVFNTSAINNLQKLDIYQQANLNGTAEERRNGSLPRQFGIQLMDSAGIALHTKGTATGYDSNGGSAIKATTIAVDGSDAGTILAGDVITWAGDSNKYIVSQDTQTASGNADGNIIINSPGLLETLADTTEGTTGGNYTPNVVLERSSMVGIMRPPLGPWPAGTIAVPISDNFGLTYLALDMQQYGQRTWELHLAWGFKVVNSEHVLVVMG